MTNRNECLPGIRRPSRFGAVWLSFRTNWTIWPIPMLFGMIFAIGAVQQIYDYFNVDRSFAFPLSSLPQMPMPVPKETIRIHEVDAQGRSVPVKLDHKIDWANLKSLCINDPNAYQELLTPGAIPNLESLEILNCRDATLIKLCELYDLKSLKLYDAQLTPASWRRLCRETSLEYLELSDIRPYKIVKPNGTETLSPTLKAEISLEWPPNLRTLVCNDYRGISLERLDEWQELPQLTTLGTTLFPQDEAQAKEMVEVLQTFPSLKTIYAMELDFQTADRDNVYKAGLHRFKSALSPNANFPWKIFATSWGKTSGNTFNYDQKRVDRVLLIVGFGLIIAIVLTLQMSSVFVGVSSMLIPQFARSHLIPVFGAFFATASLSFALFLLNECSVIAAIGLCGVASLVWSIVVRIVRVAHAISRIPTPGFTHMSILGMISGFAMPVLMFAKLLSEPFFYGATLDRFLDGGYPSVSLILLIGSVLGIYDLVQWHVHLQRNLQSKGAGEVNFSMFDMKGFQQWAVQVSKLQRKNNKPANWREWIQDQRVERFLERHQGQINPNWSERWSLVNSHPLRLLLIWFLAGCISVAAVTIPDSMKMFLAQFLLVIILVVFVQLEQGRSSFEIEFLRPITRKKWAWISLRGIAIQMLPQLLVPFAVALLILLMNQSGNWTSMQILLMAFFINGLMLAAISFGMWTMALDGIARRLAFVTAFVLIGMINMASIFLHVLWSTEQLKSITLLGPSIIGLWTIAGIFSWLAWRRWQNWELGRIS